MRTCAIVPFFMVMFWVCAFVFTRLYLFYTEYIQAVTKRENEEWLRVKCNDPDFFHKMKEHSDICLEVEQNARRSCVLQALNAVVNATYLCGFQSCQDMMAQWMGWAMGMGMPVVLGVAVLLLLLPTLVYPFMRMYLDRMADKRIMSLYNTPYGLPHYIDSQRLSVSCDGYKKIC